MSLKKFVFREERAHNKIRCAPTILLGGLMAYGVNFNELFRQSARFVDRILKGEKPADLPVQAPTKYTLVIDLKTAKALDVSIRPNLLARADEGIE